MTRHKKIKIGFLHSLSGTMKISESGLVDAMLLAVNDINTSGGVLSHELEVVVEDGASNQEIFSAKAEKLLTKDKVATIFGCWTSASRKAVKPVIEHHDSLLFYPLQYEGLEQSRNIIYTGNCLNQQIEPAVQWALEKGKRKFFLVGSDYVFPRTANSLIRAMVTEKGGQVVDEQYLSFVSEDFSGIIESIADLKPDIICNTINGQSNLSFFREYSVSGLDPSLFPIMSFSFSENELRFVPHEAAGHYVCWSYFNSLQSPENLKFINQLKNKYGSRVVACDPLATAYTQIFLWKKIVEKTGSFETEIIRSSAKTQSVSGPAGPMEIQSNNHTKKRVLIGQATKDGKFNIVWRSKKLISPKPWLGLEDMKLTSKGLVLKALENYPEIIHTNWLLRKEIFKRKEIEAKLKKAKQEAEAASRVKSMFLANMSHELRTPLTAILGFSEVLNDEMAGTLKDEQKQFVTEIHSSGKHLLNLINDILDLSKIEAGKIELEYSKFSLKDFLEKSLVLFKEKALKHKIKTSLNVFDDVTIEADERRIKQVVFNLLSNAYKFTPDGGEVKLEARRNVNEVEISVEDTGIGISKEDIEKNLFKPFQQVDTKLSKQHGGAGLGLNLSKQLVELHGGKIWAQSKGKGKGSRFTFTLPVKKGR